jgi:hypothetical protein
LQAETVLASSLIRLWKNNEAIQKSQWLIEVVGGLDGDGIRRMLMNIVEAIKSEEPCASLFHQGMQDLSLALINDGVKSSQFKLVDGRLDVSEKSASFLGRGLVRF